MSCKSTRHNESLITNLQDTSINTSMIQACSPDGIQHAALQSLSTTCQASQEPRHNSPSPASQELEPTTLSTTSAATRPASQELDTNTRTFSNNHSNRSHNTTSALHDLSSVLRTRQLSHGSSQKFMPTKTRLSLAREGPLLNQKKGHAEVLVQWKKSHEDVASGVSVGSRACSSSVHRTCTCVNWWSCCE